MISSIGLTIVGLVFTLVIAVVYFSKKKYSDSENVLYRFMVILTIFLFFLEIYCVFTMKHRDKFPLFNELMCRLYILGAVTWFVCLLIYVWISGNDELNNDKRKLFRSPFFIFSVIFCTLLYIISCFLPITFTAGVNNEIYAIGGPGVYSMYAAFAFVGGYLLYLLFRKKSKASFLKKLCIYLFMNVYFFMLVFQLIYNEINELTFTFGFGVAALYFALASQDSILVGKLEVAKKEAEKADKDKTNFLTKMSHEIRTPMNTIMGFSESLLQEKYLTKEKIEEDAKNIHVAANNLTAIINNILDVSRIESGKEKIDMYEYYFGDIVFELMSYIEARIDKHKVNFNLDIDPNIPSKLYGDKQKIYKILFNLLNNSARYTMVGEIKLTVRCECIDNIANLEFVVSDTGIGIKEENLSEVFVKFGKINNDDDVENGAGLGLNITKMLVDLLDGTIEVKSEYGVGTTFIVKISNQIVDYSKIGNILEKKDEIKSLEEIDCTGKKIMVVDDNKLNLKVIENRLNKYNFEVSLVSSGAECIERLKKKEKYDLILLDHMMPELNGIETIRIIKKLNLEDIPPIIAVTANVVTELKEMYESEGFDGWLTKPVDARDLNNLIIKYFKD